MLLRCVCAVLLCFSVPKKTVYVVTHSPGKQRDKNTEKVKVPKSRSFKLILHFMANKIVHDDRNGHITCKIFHCGAMISSLAYVVGLQKSAE